MKQVLTAGQVSSYRIAAALRLKRMVPAWVCDRMAIRCAQASVPHANGRTELYRLCGDYSVSFQAPHFDADLLDSAAASEHSPTMARLEQRREGPPRTDDELSGHP